MINFNFKKALLTFAIALFFFKPLISAEVQKPLKVDWSFKGLTGKFERSSLQRGFQVYKEVCSSCHSMQYLSYRNLGEEGGPEFTIDEVKYKISEKIKKSFDPKRILNPGKMYTGI